MSMRIALAGNPNCGKTTLFNALTGSNQFVGNWPGVTVEKKEGKLKRHDGVTITDLPGIYSLSPYTLEEVVARNYLISERPDAILNLIDGTNLERNLYLTTQLTELGIPVVVAINMMDVVEKNGDRINAVELSRALGCRVVEISALKGNGIMEAAEAAIDAAKNGKTVPMHTFSGTVEHALAHIEEAAVHGLPEEQQRWYAVKLFERDDKVLGQLNLSGSVLSHIETDIQAAEKEMDDDAESIITNERYIYIGSIIKGCLKKKSAGRMTNSDRIDRIVTNRFLGLPIFAAVMFLVYYISMVTVGASATDWANDGLFGDGFHLFGIGSAAYGEASEEYGDAALIVDGYDAYVEENSTAPTGDFPYEAADDETLEVTVETASLADYEGALAVMGQYGDEPGPADYGVWVPGIPVLVGNALEAVGAADWLAGLINDGIVAGVGAVLGFVPQMLVLFLLLAFLEACGYMARIAFVLDRIFRKFGLSGNTIILLSTIVIWFSTYFGFTSEGFRMLGEEEMDQSLLAAVGSAIAWIFIPLGWGNWQSAVASITGLVAKENIVGTMGILYPGGWPEIGANFTMAAGYSFLVFNLLCAPCFAAIGAIRREMNSAKWTWFAIGYQCGLAYAAALMVYQIGSAFMGNLNVIGLLAAIVILGGMIYMLFRPYKEATKLTTGMKLKMAK
ncbi:MAG: ferrous iron transporter B [Lachnospiraceae bacterium]